MLEEHTHHALGCRVRGWVEAQLLEMLVFSDQLRGLDGEQGEKAFQLLLARRGVQVLDDVELDVALAQDFQRAT
jgi:hypothetical protein